MSFLRWAYGANASLIFIAAMVASACDGPQTTSGTPCVAGNEKCACYANKTCNGALTCLSNVCVDANAGGSPSTGGAATSTTTVTGNGGATATGNGGATATGNGGATATGNGGATATGNGGATATGNGGATATGNGGTTVTGTGGSTATGGQSSTGGATAAGPNIIKDPLFQSFATYWNATLNGGVSGTYTSPPTAADVCITNTSTDPLNIQLAFTLGYPNAAADAFVLAAGATYTLTYRVMATGWISLEAKIGHSLSPWTPVACSFTTDILTSTYSTFTHQFTPTLSDNSAGLAFNAVLGQSGRMCFQQVTLSKN